MLKRRRIVTLLFAVAAATAALSLASAPASHAATVTGLIENGNNEMCVQQPAVTNPEGVQLMQGPCSLGTLWSFIPLGNGRYNIVSTAPNHLCLRARANADFSAVDSFGCTGVSNDVWLLSPVTGGPAANLFQIKSEISTGGEPCLDVNQDSPFAGAPIDVFHCGHNNLAQLFFI